MVPLDIGSKCDLKRGKNPQISYRWHRWPAAKVLTVIQEVSIITDLPTPKYIYQYSKQPMSVISDFWPDFFVDAPQINQNKTVSKDNFSTIHLVRTVCEFKCSIIQTHYRTGTLWHSDAFTLFVHLLNFLIEDRRTLSPKALHRVCCSHWYLEWLLSGRRLFPWFRAFFLLFISFMQLLVTNSFDFKPKISEDG